MSDSLLNTGPVKDLLGKVSGLDSTAGNERVKKVVQRAVSDICRIIED